MSSKSVLATLIAACLILSSALPASAADADKEAAHLRNIKQLTFAGSRSGEGYFSPGASQIIFQSTRPPIGPHEAENPFYQIFRMDLRSGMLWRVSPGIGKTTCSFFRPDGKRVIFASTHLDPDSLKKQRDEIERLKSGKPQRYHWDFDDHFDIFDARPDGTDLRRLTDAKGYDAEGSYSPDGKHICFTSNRDGDLEIYVMDADGTNQRRVTYDPGYDGGPFFSPDGDWVVYRHFTPDNTKAEIMMIRPDGSGKRQVTHLGAMSWAPYFHPSGKWIVFCSNTGGSHPGDFQLYLIHPDGTALTRLTYSDSFDGLPVFSPDGSKLMWTSNRVGGKSQLFIADFIPPGSETAAPPVSAPSAKLSPFSSDDIHKDINYLASPALEGRRTASPGERLAATFIEEQLHADGIGEVKEQPFDFQSGVGVGTNNAMEVMLGTEKIRGELNREFAPMPLSANGEVEGQVVFAGYGIVTENYDSFAGLDLKDKIVLILRYWPETAPENERQRLSHFAPIRMKAMQARDHGAKAVLVFAGPNSLPQDAFMSSGRDASFADSGIVAAQISRKLAEKILAAAGKNLKQTQDSLDKLETRAGFAVPGVTVKLRVDLKKQTATGHNVFAMVRAGASDRIDEAIVIGAHYDHLGHGDENSLAPKLGDIHPGADDNASGTAGVLELARYFSHHRSSLRRDLIFVCFSGEELGLLGSAAFVRNPPVSLSRVVAMVNMDMIGRLRENRIAVQGTGSAALWPRLVEQYAVSMPLSVHVHDDPYLPTDSTSFYQKDIPAVNFFTGSHADYHRPSDTADKINAVGEAEVLELERRIIADLATRAEPPHWMKVAGTSGEGPAREGLRAYLGTIPDYTGSGQPGVKLSGVRPGSPADKAGLKAGDMIVGLAHKRIANIYDYTYALEGVKIGTPVEIVIERGGKQITQTIVPTQRK
ncbi:MAG: M28 family peptidase [Candidatus Binataceae bacterium]|jgi:Tol biopolymer transport system component